jgi:hypothetical protein
LESGKERVSNELSNKLSNLLGFCFYLNRVYDRGLSLCEVRWKLINFEKVTHPLIAHSLPLLGDKISSYLSKRNVESFYPDTTGGLKDYSSPLEFFNFVLEEFNRFEDEISNTLDHAILEKDWASQQFLQGFLGIWIDYVATMNNIVDLVMQFAPNNELLGLQLFDEGFQKGLTLGGG